MRDDHLLPKAHAAQKNHDVGPPNGSINLVTLAIGFVMATLDVTVVNVAVSTIGKDLKANLSTLTWIIDGYTLIFASFLFIGGALAIRYGAKAIYIIGLIVFLIGSLFCGVASNGMGLVAARLLQGLGAALFMPSSLSLLLHTFPDPVVRARMTGYWAATVSIATGVGPLVGGFAISTFGWRSIFLINLPFGLLGIVLAIRYVVSPPRSDVQVPVVNNIFLLSFLSLLSFVLIEGGPIGWHSSTILSCYVAASMALLAFVSVERFRKVRVLSPDLLRNWIFVGGNVIAILLNTALFGLIFLLSMYLQNAKAATPLEAGYELMPMMMVFAIANLVFTRLSQIAGAAWALSMGLLLAAFGMLPLGLFSSPPYWALAAGVAISNLGVGISVPAMTYLVMTTGGASHVHIASATLNASRQFGSLVGVALTGILLHEMPDWHDIMQPGVITTGAIYFLCLLIAIPLTRVR